MTACSALICILSVLCGIFAALAVFLLVKMSANKKAQKKQMEEISLVLSTTAHDLRSPLAAIKGFADAILDGRTSGDKTEECLAVISCEADRLARITARLTERKCIIKRSVFDVCDHIRRAFLLTERKTKSKNISVELLFDELDSFYIDADSDAIFEVVYNLFENAAKYCPDEGKIVWSVSEKDGRTTVSVKNTALELPSGDIFSPGTRGKNTNEKGQGLGLFVSQMLMDAHGEKLEFSSQTDANESFVTFTFSTKSA